MKTRIDYKALGKAAGLVLVVFALLAIVVAYAFFLDWLLEKKGLELAFLAGIIAPLGLFALILYYFLFKED